MLLIFFEGHHYLSIAMLLRRWFRCGLRGATVARLTPDQKAGVQITSGSSILV